MNLLTDEWPVILEILPPELRAVLPEHPPSFLSDKDVLPLQAADLHAGLIHMVNSASMLNLPKPVIPWMTILETTYHDDTLLQHEGSK